MFKYDWKSLLKNKKLMGTIIVMMFIPILYSGIFLSSFWDPFGKTSHLAVAVVNKDVPAKIEGKKMSVGDDLVDELKDNKDFDWHFVTEKQAEQGFSDNDYYMVVTIPEVFSANAGTALDKNPKKMDLTYKINPGRNYFIESIGKNAASNINESISKKITENYVEVMFDNISELGEGFAEAADGTGKLQDGVGQVKEGNEEITKNLEKLASSTLTFKDGAQQLEVGLGQYFEGVDKLNDGAVKLEDGIAQYTDGATQLESGAQALNKGTEEYANGVNKVNEGAAQLADGASKLNEKSSDLTQGTQSLVDGSKSLSSNLVKAQEEGSAPLSEGLQTLKKESAKLTDEQQGVPALAEGQNSLNSGLKSIASGSASLKSGLVSMKDSLPQTGTISQLNEGLAGIQQLSEGIQQALAAGDTEKATALSQQLAELTKTVTPGATQALNGYSAISNGLTNQLIPGAENLNAGIQDAVQGSGNLVAGTNRLNSSIPELVEGINSAANGAQSLDGALGQLSDGSKSLVQGSEALDKGAAEYTKGVDSIHSGVGDLVSGTGQLAEKSGELTSGANELASGASALAGNSKPLIDGSSQLASGISQLAENAPALSEGSSKLASGADQIKDGSEKLAEGSNNLGDGLNKVADGTEELGSKLSDGATEVQEVEADDSNYSMMADPTNLNLVKTSDVPNYAHALAPNFLSIALYIGALAFNIIIPLGIAAIPPKSGREWWFSKFSIAAVQAIMGALIMDAIMIKGLELQVDHIGLFVFISIMASLTYMFMIMMLNVALGNPGRFVAMIGLVLQLASSGAMFPRELTAPFFEAINPYVPMTYVIFGFREAMSSAEGMPIFWESIAILAGLILVFNIVLLFVFKKKKDKGKDILVNSEEAVA
ncbi:YhgE/Pip domain-containing protein [Mesobacillus foraminis]|uniref:YhgE/Pip family protein n=1 Tax=Mesobacillus foraminis TaxID=279826 RepID=UPI0039A1FEBB